MALESEKDADGKIIKEAAQGSTNDWRRLGSHRCTLRCAGPLRFVDHSAISQSPKLAPELARLGISDLCEADLAHQVGPVEFNGGRCTAPLTYYLYGEGELSKYDEGGSDFFAEVHILGGIGNKPGGGGENLNRKHVVSHLLAR